MSPAVVGRLYGAFPQHHRADRLVDEHRPERAAKSAWVCYLPDSPAHQFLRFIYISPYPATRRKKQGSQAS